MKKLILLFATMMAFTSIIFSTTITIGQEGNPRTFDPHFGNDGYSLRINRLLYSRLFEKNSNMQTVPGLAKDYKFVDNTTIDFTLQDNIYFQNGEKLTPEDVKFSFERMKKSPRIASVLPPIKDITVTGDNSFRMVLEKPFSGIIDQLTHPALAIVSQKYLLENPDILIEKPMGTGKYILENSTSDETLTLKKFEGYFGEKSSYNIIQIKTIPLATNRTIALETGEVDLTFSIPPQDKKIIEKKENLAFISKPSYSYTYLGLNLKKEIFNNPDIRLGINLAIDKEAILDVILNGDGEIANSPVAKGVSGYNQNLKNLDYNKTMASKLLKSIEGKTLTLATMNNGTDIQIAELVQAYLKDVGLNVKISVLEANIYWLKTNEGEFDMFIGNWGSVTGDSDYALYPTHHSNSFGAPGNRTFFNNEQVDILLEKARGELNENQRNEYYMEIQEIIVNNNSEVMLFYRNLNGAINKKIQNFDLYPVPIHDYSLGNIVK